MRCAAWENAPGLIVDSSEFQDRRAQVSAAMEPATRRQTPSLYR